MTSPSDLLQRAHEGLQLHMSGEHDRAREHLAALWDELGEHGHPLVRCSVAHYLADLQSEDDRSSLRWNTEALREANRVDDPAYVDPDLGVSTSLLYPSLLLNLAEDHRRLAEFESAGSVLSAARESLARLDPDDRPLGVPEALDELDERLAVDTAAAVTSTDHSSRWFRFHRRVAAPRVRLLCLPHAGGTASFFRGWPRHLDASVEVAAVQYPGRENRLAEPCVTDMDDMTAALADAIISTLPDDDAALVLFGHSMGASVAHEVTARLESRGVAVAALVVSARPAAHYLRPNDLTARPDDAALIDDVRRLDTTAGAVLDDPDLLDVVLPALRSDYTLVETYPRQQPRLVTAPIIGYSADNDPEVSVDDVRAWSAVTRTTFELRVYSGDHFFLVPHEADVVGDIDRRVLAGLPSKQVNHGA